VFPWGGVKHTVTEGRPDTLCFISLAWHPHGNAARESRALWRCRLFLAFFRPVFSRAGQETGELMLNLGVCEVAAGLQSDTLQAMRSPSLVVLV